MTATALISGGAGCKRHEASAKRQPPSVSTPAPAAEAESSPTPPPQRLAKLDHTWSKGHPREVLATWYDVPFTSLAKRRAGLEELTAAHNRLPIGTLVRVTHLANGKSVQVRITDRGIHDKRVKLDLCKEAAEELDMIDKGIARVRMEVLEESDGSSPAPSAVAAQR